MCGENATGRGRNSGKRQGCALKLFWYDAATFCNKGGAYAAIQKAGASIRIDIWPPRCIRDTRHGGVQCICIPVGVDEPHVIRQPQGTPPHRLQGTHRPWCLQAA